MGGDLEQPGAGYGICSCWRRHQREKGRGEIWGSRGVGVSQFGRKALLMAELFEQGWFQLPSGLAGAGCLPNCPVPHSLRCRSYGGAVEQFSLVCCHASVLKPVPKLLPPVNYCCWAVRYLHVEGVHLPECKHLSSAPSPVLLPQTLPGLSVQFVVCSQWLSLC